MCYLFDWMDFYSCNWRQIWSRKRIRNLSSVFYWLMLQKNMKAYCVKYRKNTENLNSKIFKIKNGRLRMTVELESSDLWKNKKQKDY